MPMLATDTDLSPFVVRIEGETVAEFPVTDVTLEIVKHEGDARAMLSAPNDLGRDRHHWAFYVSFQITAGGKSYDEGGGNCSLWENDISYCGVEDDGGHFLLTRQLYDGYYDLTVILRTFPEIFETSSRTDIVIGYDGFSGVATYLDLTGTNQASFTFVNPDRMR